MDDNFKNIVEEVSRSLEERTCVAQRFEIECVLARERSVFDVKVALVNEVKDFVGSLPGRGVYGDGRNADVVHDRTSSKCALIRCCVLDSPRGPVPCNLALPPRHVRSDDHNHDDDDNFNHYDNHDHDAYVVDDVNANDHDHEHTTSHHDHDHDDP